MPREKGCQERIDAKRAEMPKGIDFFRGWPDGWHGRVAGWPDWRVAAMAGWPGGWVVVGRMAGWPGGGMTG